MAIAKVRSDRVSSTHPPWRPIPLSRNSTRQATLPHPKP